MHCLRALLALVACIDPIAVCLALSGFWEQLKRYEERCAADRGKAQAVPVLGT
jgi:hypothetical protein